MKKISTLAISMLLAMGLLTTSCSNDETLEKSSAANGQNNNITISEEGYLVFPDAEALQTAFESVENGNGLPITNITRAGSSSFVSLVDLEQKIEESQTRSTFAEEDDDELEEMTVDEFNLMKAEELIMDDVLEHFVDTTLRICVGDRLYKITNKGTFSVKKKNAKNLELAINDIEPQVLKEVQPGMTINLENDVTYTNTFGEINTNNGNDNIDVLLSNNDSDDNDDDSDNITIGGASLIKSASNTLGISNNNFHSDYNVETHLWESKGFKKFLEWLKIKTIRKSNYFNKKHRVRVRAFDVNYKFYASAGIKVKLQKRKKFCGIKYWVKERAQKLAIGFNSLEGIMKYKDPCSFSNITPAAEAQWGHFVHTLNGIQSDFIYGIVPEIKFIKDWTPNIIAIVPKIPGLSQNWIETTCNKLYQSPAELVYSAMKKIDNKYIYYPIKQQIMPKDPKLAYFVWGVSTIGFDKEHPFITGVKEFSDLKSKSIIFDRSFGFNISGKTITGFLPSEFDIKGIDAFGAAYYDNRWLGVRITTK